MTVTTQRKTNFSPGPAVLPTEVVEEARENLLSYGETGLGIMEISHRGKVFTKIIEGAEADVRELLGLSDDFAVLFLTGGASQQFWQVPLNLLRDEKANYLNTGAWSTKAIEQARAYGAVVVAATSEDKRHTYIPKTFDYAEGAIYTHFTSNNTIFGTQWPSEPESPDPLICDASSDILSRPIAVEKYGLIYAGAQKNLGPAGVTLVIVRRDLAERGSKTIPTMLQYRTQIANNSLYNTAPTFPIYVVSLVLKWLKAQGGLAAMAERNGDKAAKLYGLLDSSGFWRTPVERDSRSKMNVVFRLPSEELEERLIKEADAAGFAAIKGHRSVGGIRVSLYNAITPEEVSSFVDFLQNFERTNG